MQRNTGEAEAMQLEYWRGRSQAAGILERQKPSSWNTGEAEAKQLEYWRMERQKPNNSGSSRE
jgi:hypothetical protein